MSVTAPLTTTEEIMITVDTFCLSHYYYSRILSEEIMILFIIQNQGNGNGFDIYCDD